MIALIQHNVFVHFHQFLVSIPLLLLLLLLLIPLQFLQLIKVHNESIATWYTAYIYSSFVLAYVAAAILTPILTAIPTVSPSPTVTQSPVMMGGVNVAAAVAIPVVLVLLLLLLLIGVVGVVGYYKCFQINKGLLSTCMPWCT